MADDLTFEQFMDEQVRANPNWKDELDLPPTTGQELTAPDESFRGQAYSAGREVGVGVSNSLGTIMGITPEIWEAFGRFVGSKDAAAPGEPTAYMKDLLTEYGMPTGTMDTAAARYGETTMDNLLLLGGGLTVAPKLAKSSWRIPKEIGTALKNRPGQAVAETVTGSAGQVVGEELSPEGEEFAGGTAGYVVGSMPGTIISSAGRKAINMFASPFDRSHKALMGVKPPAAPSSVIASGASATPDLLTPPAKARVAKDFAMIERRMNKVMDDIAPRSPRGKKLSPDEANKIFETEVEKVHDLARSVESKRWNDAIKGEVLDDDLLKSEVDDWLAQARVTETEGSLPAEIVREIANTPEGVPIAAEKVNGWASTLYAQRKALEKDPAWRGDKSAMRRNYEALEELIRTHMELNLPDGPALQEARALTRERKSLFANGPMGAARYMQGRGRTMFTDTTTGADVSLDYAKGPASQAILGQRGGLEQLSYASGRYQPNTLLEDYANAIKTDYLAKAFPDYQKPAGAAGRQAPDPAVAQRYATEWQDRVRAYKPLMDDIQHTSDSLRVLQKIKNDAERGALARISNDAEPEKVVRSLFDSPGDLPVNLRKMTSEFGKDPQALEAWRRIVVNEIFRRSGNKMDEALQLIKDRPLYDQALRLVYASEPGKVDRLYKILEHGAQLGTKDEGGLRGAAREAATILARIGGAGLGRSLGTGTIQTPQIISSRLGNVVARWAMKVLPETPGDIVTQALQNPAMERWLMARIPSDQVGLRRMLNDMKMWSAIANNSLAEGEWQLQEQLGIPEDER